jgi:hypothetical protein
MKVGFLDKMYCPLNKFLFLASICFFGCGAGSDNSSKLSNVLDGEDQRPLKNAGIDLARAPEIQPDRMKTGGADAILCTAANGAVKSVELLDAFEAREIWKLPIRLGAPSKPYQEKVRDAIQLMAKFDPSLAKLIEASTNRFINSFYSHPNAIPSIDDEGKIVLVPSDCKLMQLAIQVKPEFEGDVEYYVDANMFQFLDEDNKAVLALHEGVYEVARNTSAFKDSFKVRYFLAHVLGQILPTLESFNELLVNLTFTRERHGLKLEKIVDTYDSGEIRTIEVINGGNHGVFFGNKLDLYPGSKVEFYRNGELLSASFCYKRVSLVHIEDSMTSGCRETDDAYPSYVNPTTLQPAPITINKIGRTYFHENGVTARYDLLVASLRSFQPLVLDTDRGPPFGPTGFNDPMGLPISLKLVPHDQLSFYSTGVPVEVVPNYLFKATMNHCVTPFGAPGLRSTLQFHENGYVKFASYYKNWNDIPIMCENSNGIMQKLWYDLKFNEFGYIVP